MLVLRTSNFQGATTRPIVPRHKHSGIIHAGIFRGRALWADSVSPRMNTIASRHQLKPIRIGDNLVVNYKG